MNLLHLVRLGRLASVDLLVAGRIRIAEAAGERAST
jgi:hypothetical protein